MRHRLHILSILGSLTIAAQPASASDFGAAIEVLHSTRGETVVSPSYHWSAGDCDGFGFIDALPGGGPLDFLTDNTVNCQVAGPVFVTAEVGGTNFGATAKAGIGVNVPVPGMRFARVKVYPLVAGDDRPQLGVVGMSEDIEITDGVAVYFSGFADFRLDAPDVIQPQIWARIDGVPVEVGSELAIFGSDVAVFAAVKFSF